jgi:hypothetical protein
MNGSSAHAENGQAIQAAGDLACHKIQVTTFQSPTDILC